MSLETVIAQRRIERLEERVDDLRSDVDKLEYVKDFKPDIDKIKEDLFKIASYVEQQQERERKKWPLTKFVDKHAKTLLIAFVITLTSLDALFIAREHKELKKIERLEHYQNAKDKPKI